MSLLDQAAAPPETASGVAYESVRESVTDPDNDRKSYAVDKRVSDGALILRVETTRKDKDPTVRRIPLAPVGRALALGVID